MTARILLVEDEVKLARFIELELSSEGYLDNMLLIVGNDCLGPLSRSVVRSAIGCELSGMQSVGRFQNVFDPLFSRRLPHAA